MSDHSNNWFKLVDILLADDVMRALRPTAILLVCLSLMSLAGYPGTHDPGWGNLTLNASLGAVASFTLLYLIAPKRIRLAAYTSLLIFGLILFQASWNGAGVKGIAYTMCVLLVLGAALFIGKRAGYVAAILISLYGLLLVAANRMGWLTAIERPVQEIVAWITLAITFVLSAHLVRLTVDQAERALTQAQLELKERVKAEETIYRLNMDLEQMVSERTAQLAASEERYRNFVEQSSEGIWYLEFDAPISLKLPVDEQVHQIHQRGYFGDCNDALAKMYGLSSRKDMIGKRLLENLYGGHISEVNAQATLRLVTNGYRSSDQLTEEYNRHGDAVFFLNNAIGIRKDDHLIGIWSTQRDITELKKAEQALQVNQARYQALFEQTNDAVFIISLEGIHLAANQQAARLSGYDAAEIVGMPIRQIVAPGDYPDSQDKLKALLAGESLPVYERMMRRKNGDVFPVEINAALVKDDTADTFFRRADRALYLAKERGRDRVET